MDMIRAADKPTHPLHLWKLVSQVETSAVSGAIESHVDAWLQQNEQAAAWYAKHQQGPTVEAIERLEGWYGYGNGTVGQRAPAGEFTISSDGAQVVTSVLPSGYYSHLLSTKHRGVFASPRFNAESGTQLWIEMTGIGNPTARYVVQDYPRDGTVYPITRLNQPSFYWQSYSVDYWKGDSLHFELATAGDGPIVNDGSPRSGFGIRRALVVKNDEGRPPANELEYLMPLLERVRAAKPATREALAAIYQEVTLAAINAWQQGRLNDAQALWLNALLSQQILANEATKPAMQDLVAQYRQLESEVAEPYRVPGVLESVAYDQPLFVRGDHRHPADPVPRAFLSVLDSTPFKTTLSGRRELAERLVSANNPLTSRVMVNRIWAQLFGKGLVRSVDNFGLLGDSPTHPELLDYLATEFQRDGWSLKRMIRQLVLSQTWQQQSAPSQVASERDPENRYWTHATVRRLEAEAIRDALLQVSGKLESGDGGPSVDGRRGRRSVYVRVQRNSLDPFLRVFDFPEPSATVGRRDSTNVPAQALTMLNDPQVIELARAWAERVIAKPAASDDVAVRDQQRLREMFLIAFAREPSSAELTVFAEYRQELRQTLEDQRQKRALAVAQIEQLESQIDAIESPVRDRLRKQVVSSEPSSQSTVAQPIARWDFDDGQPTDRVGKLHGSLKNGAKIEGGSLWLDGQNDYFVTEPLERSIGEKSFEAWVQVTELKQAGGGVITLQSENGRTFDSLVFAEQSPRRWLAGSDTFQRTQPFRLAPEESVTDRTVHLVITYASDGTIAAYRNGEPYGAPYSSSGLMTYPAKQSVVTLGLRHLPATGNRCFRGKIDSAALYDRVLTAAEVRTNYVRGGGGISAAEVWAALSPAEQEQLQSKQQALAEQRAAVEALVGVDDLPVELHVWTEVARALFSMKEMIYLR